MILKVGIVGLGRIAFLLEKDKKRTKPCTHLGTYLKFPKIFQIVGGVDINPAKKKEFQKKVPQALFYSSLEDLLANKQIDILSIATPASTHQGIFEKLLNVNALPKLIWLEKPIEVSLEKAIKIKEIKDKLKINILVNHERRYDPYYQKVREIIEKKTLGVLKSIHAMMYTKVGSNLSPFTGSLLEDGTHLIDIILYLTQQRPLSIHSYVEWTDSKIEKRTFGILNFRGFPVFFDTGGDRKYFHFELDISFSEGRIRIGNGIFSVERQKQSPYYEGFKSLMTTRIKVKKSNMFINIGKEILHFFEKKIPLTSTLEDSIEVMKIIQQIYKQA